MDTSAIPPGSGDDPPQERMWEPRVFALETSVASIDKTLAVMAEQMKHLASRDDVGALRTELASISGKLDTDIASLGGRVDTRIATLSGKIDGMATAVELAELKGRVARIPTVPVLVSILIFISLLFAAASWAVRHLPESWSRALS